MHTARHHYLGFQTAALLRETLAVSKLLQVCRQEDVSARRGVPGRSWSPRWERLGWRAEVSAEPPLSRRPQHEPLEAGRQLLGVLPASLSGGGSICLPLA